MATRKEPGLRPDSLQPEDMRRLADALGDTIETTIEVHLLERGLCKAYVGGSHFGEVAIVQGIFDPAELAGFGRNPTLLWEILKIVKGWDCVEVETECAQPLGDLIRAEWRTPVRYYDDVYLTPQGPVQSFGHANVRRLTDEDVPLLTSAPSEIRGGGFKDVATMLSEGVVAGAFESGQLVAIAHVSALTQLHGEIGVGTLAPFRQRGYATAAASIVATELQGMDKTPVWSTGVDNYGSLAVAEKLGFEEVSRRKYVIPDKQSCNCT